MTNRPRVSRFTVAGIAAGLTAATAAIPLMRGCACAPPSRQKCRWLQQLLSRPDPEIASMAVAQSCQAAPAAGVGWIRCSSMDLGVFREGGEVVRLTLLTSAAQPSDRDHGGGQAPAADRERP